MSSDLLRYLNALMRCLPDQQTERRSESEHACLLTTDIVICCNSHFKTSTELATACSLLFNNDFGILAFLRKCATLNDFHKSKTNLLEYLPSFFDKIKKTVLKYALEIKNVCVYLFNSDKRASVRIAIFGVLIKLLEFCPGTDFGNKLDPHSMMETFYLQLTQQSKLTPTVLQGIYHFLGVLVETFPEYVGQYANRLLTVYFSELKKQMTSRSRAFDKPIITGCFCGLIALMNSFPRPLEDEEAKQLFTYARMAVKHDQQLSRYDIPKGGLQLVHKHATYFAKHLYEDYEYFYNNLYGWSQHSNRDTSILAYLALEAFFQQVAAIMCADISEDDRRRPAAELKFKFFLSRFSGIFQSDDSSRWIAVAVKGYGMFAAPCKLLMDANAVRVMFADVLQHCEKVFFSDSEMLENKIQFLPSFVESLASISLQLDEISEIYLPSLENLAVFLIEHFPMLLHVHRFLCYHALIKVLVVLYPKGAIFKTFIAKIVYQGLLRTCSHAVVVEVERDGENAEETVDRRDGSHITYKDYLPLWSNLLDAVQLKALNTLGIPLAQRQAVTEILYDEILSTILGIVRKLDFLTLKSCEEETDDASATSDPVVGLRASNPTDFQIFVNLVDFCKSLLPKKGISMFKKWIYKFGYEIISLSSKFPLVSGFYKLLAVCFEICSCCRYFKNVCPDVQASFISVENLSSTKLSEKLASFVLFSKYAKEIVVRSQQYKDDLLTSCVRAVLALPSDIVANDLSRFIPAICTAFRIGPSYLPMAHDGLRALETWSSELSLDVLLPLFCEVLPLLNAFLKTAIGMDEAETVTLDGKKSLRSRSRRIPIKVIKNKSKLESMALLPEAARVKRRIVRLLGNLGTGVNRHLIDDSSRTIASSAVAWDTNRHLKFAVPFADMKPSIDLDVFLPRVVELTCTSSDRQVKVAASELLHAVVLFLLGSGTTQTEAVQQKKPMTSLYRKILPVLLQLACDVDSVVRKLFEPLTMQLIHWFSWKLDENTNVLLDALMDGVVNSSSNAIRDFSSRCIKEYLIWSIKQSTPQSLARNPYNTKALLRRVYNSCLHPDSFVRLGAALLFNVIFTVFREEEALVSIFILELLYHFVQSLAIAQKDEEQIGTKQQCTKALQHIERIMIRKSQLLTKKDCKRRTPKEFAAGDLESAVMWLLEQCGRPETECRHRCMDLVYTLIPHLSHGSSTEDYFQLISKERGVEFFITKFEGVGRASSQRQYLHSAPTLRDHLLDGFSVPGVVSWFDGLLATLDCYIWSFTMKALRPEDIFVEGSRSVVLTSVKYFITNLSVTNVWSLALSYDRPDSCQLFTPSEVNEFNHSKCVVIVRILDFIEAVIQSSNPCSSAFHQVFDEIVQDAFWDLFLRCVLCPLSVGFDMSSLEIMANLPKKTEHLLVILKKSLPASHLRSFTTVMARTLTETESCNVFGQLSADLSLLDFAGLLSLSHLVAGCEQIHRAGLLLPALMMSAGDKNSLANDVFQAAWKMCVCNRGGVVHAVRLEGAWQSLAQKIIGFSFSLQLPLDDLIVILMDDSLLTDPDGHSHLQKGAHLLATFHPQVTDHLVRTAPDSITKLVRWTRERPFPLANVLFALFDHLATDKKLRKAYGSVVSEAVLVNWSKVHHWWQPDANEDLKHLSVSLLTKVLIIDSKVVTVAHHRAFGEVFEMFLTLLVDKTTLRFKSRVLDALPFFLRLPSEELNKLRSSLAKMASQNFPLKSSELPLGSLRCSEYISAFQKILYALKISGSLMLLEFIAELVCTESMHICEDDIQTTLQAFVKRLPNDRICAAIELPLEIFWNENNPVDVRRSVLDRISMPLLKGTNKVAVFNFYTGNIKRIMSILQEKPVKSTDEKFQQQLFSKTGCFKLVQVLYDFGSRDELNSLQSKVNRAFCDDRPKSGRELTQEVTRAAHATKKENVRGETPFLEEMRRQYRCAAYNALVAVISCTQTEAKFYNTFLFTENTVKGDFLWDNLVDTTRTYEFAIELNSPMEKRKQLVDIRQTSREARQIAGLQEDQDFELSYNVSLHQLTSWSLADSSLSEDVAQFDFTSSSRISSTMMDEGIAVISQRKTEDIKPTLSTSYLDIELDELNRHECMASLNAVLVHMTSTSISPAPLEANDPATDSIKEEMPTWMKNVHAKLSNDDARTNVKLFLAKLIVNNEAIFKPYAKFWLYPLMQLIVGGAAGRGLNYFVKDLVVILLSWSTVAIPQDSAVDRAMATRLLEFLMQNVGHARREILRNNLEVLKTLVECWKDRLDIPTKIIYDHLCNSHPEKLDNIVGIQLLGIVLANGLPPYSPVIGLNEDTFLETLAKNLTFKSKDVYGAAAEVVGMCLKHLSQRYQSSEFPFHHLVQKHLSKMSETQLDRFIACLHHIQTSYPPVNDGFLRKILFVLPQIHGIFRHLGLEIVLSRLEAIDGIYLELKSIGFHSFLIHEDDVVQTLCLQMVDKMLRWMTADQLLELLPLITQCVGHRLSNCRKPALEILFWIYDNYRDDRSDIILLTKDALLRGLADDDLPLRLMVLNFWSDAARLSTATLERATALLEHLYCPTSERHFLGYATYLLLEMTSRSPDYNRPLFANPLKPDCKFEAYDVSASWQQRHSTMLPLFVETLSSASVSSQPMQPPIQQLRATQDNLEFTPTQGTSKTYNWLTQSSVDTFSTVGVTGDETVQSNLLFNVRKFPRRTSKAITGTDLGKNMLKLDQVESSTKGETGAVTDLLRLRRRFLKENEAEQRFHARRSEKLRQQRVFRLQEQKLAREAQVTIYRQYRQGDLPDIQINHSAIIAPLQALAQRDDIVAKILFTHLVTGILKEANDLNAIETVANSLDAILEKSTSYTAAVISTVQELAYHFSKLKLDVENLVSTSRTSFQQNAGILLLEKMILDSPDADEPQPAKKPRQEMMHSPDKFLWIKLAELNKSIGCYDVVNGIFTHHVTSETAVREALAAEAVGDYSLAKKCYQRVFVQSGRSAEPSDLLDSDLWNECMLECLEKLNDWEKCASWAVQCFDDSQQPSLDSVWDDVFHQEHYLPFVIRGKLRLILRGEKEQSLVTFLDGTLANSEHPQRRQFLESRFSQELALLSIVQKDYDRARSYRGAFLQGFLQDWLALSDLSIFHLKARLADLQALVEMEEFLDVIEESGNRFEERAINLLTRWEKNRPDAHCDVATLDNLAVNRRLFLKHLSARPLLSGTSEREGGFKERFEKMCLKSQLSLSMTCIEAAGRQNNSTVALAYLKDSVNLCRKLNDSFLTSKWTHTYCQAHLLNMKKQTSRSKLGTLFNVWRNLDKDLESEVVLSNVDLRLENLLLQSQNAQCFVSCLEEDFAVLKDAANDELKRLLERIGCTSASNLPLLRSSLTEYSYRQLEAAVSLNESTQIAAAHLHLAKFCDRHLRDAEVASFRDRYPSLDEFPEVIVKNLLAAMKLGHLEAMQLFPRLLQLVEKHSSTTSSFVRGVANIPCWMFLSWIGQLVSILDKPHGAAIHDLVSKIAQDYPNALIYPFMVSKKGFTFADSCEGKRNKVAVDRIWHSLSRLELVQWFIFALEQLTVPSLAYQDVLEDLYILKQKDAKAFQNLFQDTYDDLFVKPLKEDMSNENPVPYGRLRKRFAKEMGKLVDKTFGPRGDNLGSMSVKEFHEKNTVILKAMKTWKPLTLVTTLLKDHCDWLSEFHQAKFGTQLEIPGQYRGYAKPMPEYHRKIARFDEKVRMLPSVRQPKCITIYGDDHKAYKFLVKGGEDLRQDQRVQQLFQMMNEIYWLDPACRSRQLSVVTYQVIPLNDRLGILEWVKDTVPLKEFLESSMDDFEKDKRLECIRENDEWISQVRPREHIYQKFDRNQTIEHYRRLTEIFPKNILKKAFLRMSASIEAYLVLRNTFITSHAVASISQYVLGIGDRHLSNFMICQETGTIVAIDFGHAFGSATTLLSIPELMPFRLTPQFLQLMEPMREHGLFEMGLIHSLNALRCNKELLLNTMDVFINEPSLDWIRNARKQLRQAGTSIEDRGLGMDDFSWYPQEKVNFANRKLAGGNSARIMAEELELGHKKKKVFPCLLEVCIGDEAHNLRSQLPGEGLHVEKQVACLLDHATDPHILGKTYRGWSAWV